MQVSKLIERLQSFPGDLEVYIDSYGDQAMYSCDAASFTTYESLEGNQETMIVLEHVPTDDDEDDE